MKVIIRYKIFQIVNGLLVEPESWDTQVFSRWGYRTQEEALAAALDMENLVILPVVMYVYDNEDG